jgi:hypothetical protein
VFLVEQELHFVRVFRGNLENWNKDSPEIAGLANAFDLGESANSVYEVGNGEEECLATAAHRFPRILSKLEAETILRVTRDDLLRCGIGIGEFEFGRTGIPKWDGRHCNIVASREELLKLIQHLHQKHLRGFECVRRIDKGLMQRSMVSLTRQIDFPSCLRSLVGEWTPSSPPTVTEASVRQALEEACFDDLVLGRVAVRISSNDTVKDWYSALSTLRQQYCAEVASVVISKLQKYFPQPDSVADQSQQ